MEKDLTTGNITPQLIRFTIPLVLGNIFQLMYNAIDSIIVGRFVGSHALAAVGICNPISTLFILFLNGLCMGASILMGNMLSSNVVALNAYYSGLKREQQLYRYLLGNGATRAEAQAPFIKQAIIKSFSPLIANIAVMGLVALPGTMIGQILGGSSPNVAIKYQMMIMVITFTASMLSLMITISLASRKSFDSNGKLLQVMVEKKEKKKSR